MAIKALGPFVCGPVIEEKEQPMKETTFKRRGDDAPFTVMGHEIFKYKTHKK